ncbi:DUF1048 domain-containing protein [Lapillicoccus jejuensis]|uniref:DNA-binding ferritin-like protein (Dps family) n=1 Tax=Lapillicoccus jejuensis TaxID=402171 RepID=A0A542E1Y5_9MICO|nr:DUF1048 domain-containing protein [Lapillicoccus jejuensis]TQJ09350.1 DNA-binding ferritin-like protein (Dps family) [Lapillicoccus jejuensis]
MGWIQDKRRWRAYKRRTAALPAPYRETADALERYFMMFGPGDGPNVLRLCDDLVDLLEQAAADGTPVRAVVGEDPVDFADEFLRGYPDGSWVTRERTRLTTAIDRATTDRSPS